MQIAAWVQASSGVLTLLAAVVAAWIASQVPKWTEEHRARARTAEQVADLQRGVLLALLKGRSALMHQDTLAAINLIDFAFIDSPVVRDARRNFMVAASAEPFSAELLLERFHSLIVATVREVGLSSTITTADIQQGYYPQALTKIDEAALADAEEKIARKAAGFKEA